MRNPDRMQHVVIPELRKFNTWHTLTTSLIFLNRRSERTRFPNDHDFLPLNTMEQQAELDERTHAQM